MRVGRGGCDGLCSSGKRMGDTISVSRPVVVQASLKLRWARSRLQATLKVVLI